MHSIEGRAIVYKHQPHIVLFIAVSVDEGGVKDVRCRPIGVVGELEWVDGVRDGGVREGGAELFTTEHCMSSQYATSHLV